MLTRVTRGSPLFDLAAILTSAVNGDVIVSSVTGHVVRV